MKLTILLILLTIIIPTAHSTPKSGELLYIGNNKPLALVIGNRSYQYKPLTNTINDARDMKKVLENLGFEVILKTNLTQIQMLDAIDNFTDRLLESQTVGLFYFSGHGANVAGTNYLLPIDNKKIRRARHLRSYAIDTHKILKTMERDRSNSINIMILDACRDDPFPNSDRSLSRGLGRINTRGSIIAFATAIGDTTPDNSPNGRNGLFTYHLLSGLNKAYQTNQRIVDMFIEVINGVKKDTNGRQIPWYNSSLQGKYCIGGCKANHHTSQSITKLKNYFQDPLKNGDLGPKMTWIPAGSVIMGNKTIGIGRFAMGIYEVTVSEYLRFVKSTGSNLPEWQKYANVSRIKRYYSKLGGALKGDNYPIVGISWHDAMAYTKWLSEQTGETYTLPTEAQWQYAARAGSQSIKTNKANCFLCGDRFKYTAPVGSFLKNPFGLYDMLGNVQEWTCSEYQYTYKGEEQKCVDRNRIDSTRLSLRGGSWNTEANKLQYRNKWSATTRYATIGFRVVKLMN
jgi:formylglycine-generating enzyme required for sulfatase activity